MKTYLGREVSRETIALSTGGQIDRDGKPEMPPKSVVTIQAKAIMDSTKHKFLDDGTVQEITTLTLDTASFAVLEVEQPVEPDQLRLGHDIGDVIDPNAPDPFEDLDDEELGEPAALTAPPAASGAGPEPGKPEPADHVYAPSRGTGGPCKVCGAGPNTGIHDERRGLSIVGGQD